MTSLSDEERRAKRSEYNKAYRAKNRERLLQADRDRYWSNPEKARQYAKDYQEAHYDERAEYRRKWRALNSEKLQQYRQNYRLSIGDKEYRHQSLASYYRNPERQRVQDRKRRALKRGAETEPYTFLEILETYGDLCHLCGEPIDMSAPRAIGSVGWERGLHLDHVIPLAAGGNDLVDNIRPSHGLCNLLKSARPS